MTKRELLELLKPYGLEEPVVFITFDGDSIAVHEHIEVGKSHSTVKVGPDGTVSMPVGIYLVDDRREGRVKVMG